MLRKFVYVWAFLTLTATASAQAPNLFFTPPVLTSKTGVTAGTAAADINGDGKLDFLFTDGTVWVSKADGTYQAGTPWCTVAQTYCSQPGLPVLVAAGDFNHDGKADIAVATSNFVFVLLGKGDGTFQAAVSSVTGSAATTVVVADVNGDGKPDVLLVGGTGAVPVLLGKGDGTFQAAIAGPNLAGLNLQFIAAADLNGDHKVDILGFLRSGPLQLDVFTGNGDGTFSNTPIVTSPGMPQTDSADVDWQVADMDGDGKLDVVVSLSTFGNATQQPQATYLGLGRGDGTFGTPTQIASRGGLISVGDFNGDGVPDLALVGPDVDVLIGTGGGQVTLKESYFAGFSTTRAIVGDFNGDGKTDAFVGAALLLGNGDGTLRANPVSYFASTVTPSVLADFNGDGKADLAVAGNSGETIDILTGDGTGQFAAGFASPTLSALPGLVDLKATDVTGDGKIDLVAIISTLSPSVGWVVYVLAGNGDGTFEAPVAVAQSSQFVLGAAQLADVNNDQRLDLIVSDSSGAINVFLGNGDGSFTASNTFFSGLAGPVSFVTGDFNGDGKSDLIVGLGSGLSFFPGKGDGTFGTAVSATKLIGGVTAVADFNGDGILDLCGSYVVVLGNGDGTFKVGSTIPNTVQPVNYNAAVDVNGDGKIDLVGSSTGGHVGEQVLQYALGNGDGTFTPVVLEDSRSQLSFVGQVVGDVNGDGRPDIVFSFIGSLISLLNTQPPAAPDFSTTVTTPSSSTVSAGQSATFGFNVAPMAGFAQTVNFTCSGAPANSTCTVSPMSAMVSGSTPVAIKVTVATTAASLVSSVSFKTSPKGPQWPVGLIVVAALLAILVAMSKTFVRCDHRRLAAARFRWATDGCSLVLVATSLLLISCGGGGSSSSGSQSGANSGTAAGSYTIKVTGTSGSGPSAVSHTVTFTLTVQ
jgi:hypothetical protein